MDSDVCAKAYTAMKIIQIEFQSSDNLQRKLITNGYPAIDWAKVLSAIEGIWRITRFDEEVSRVKDELSL